MFDRDVIMRQRQLDVRCEMDARGFHLKTVAGKAGIPYSTIISYFPGEKDRQPAVIPGSAIYAMVLANALPLDILSMLMPSGVVLVRAPEGIDHDEIENAARDFLATKGAAHHPASPGGREISDCERATLDGKVAVLRAA